MFEAETQSFSNTERLYYPTTTTRAAQGANPQKVSPDAYPFLYRGEQRESSTIDFTRLSNDKFLPQRYTAEQAHDQRGLVPGKSPVSNPIDFHHRAIVTCCTDCRMTNDPNLSPSIRTSVA